MMTKEDIKEKIQWLEDDTRAAQNILDNGKGTREERAEYRARIRANDKEIMHLKSLLITIRANKLF